MSLSGNDVVITVGSETYGYVLNQDDPQSIVHSSEVPNVPLNTGMSTPTQAGGVYDVRDSSGDKAITHLDWSGGAGQNSLDAQDATYNRFMSSRFIDTAQQGKLILTRPFTALHMDNVGGPVYSALGYLWMGMANGALKYSTNNGQSWSDATITSGPTSAISGFATDGTNVFICCSGAVSGLWSWNGSGSVTFQSYTSVTAALEKLAYNGGTLYGATGDGAGVFDLTANGGEGSYTEETATFITGANSTVELVQTQNSVYWVVSKNARSYVYRLWNDAGTVYTEQFAEFPAGFIATCALGYLGNVDVGGYFESFVSGVGQGAVYRTTSSGEMSILFRLGNRPEDTETPSATTNDNRIRACCSGGTDTYWLTERELFRWDLQSGGYNHIGDFLGCGAPSRVVTEASVDTLPTGGTITTLGEYKVHTFTSSGTFTVPTHRDSNGNIITTVPVEYLVVAGGGGGGDSIGGGGGAGGVLTATGHLADGAITVTVGPGGAHNTAGSNSVFDTSVIAEGGGKGGNSATAGGAGGSGGGAGKGTDGTPEAGGTASQDSNGGANAFYTGGGGVGATGGGGGAGSVGEAGSEGVPA